MIQVIAAGRVYPESTVLRTPRSLSQIQPPVKRKIVRSSSSLSLSISYSALRRSLRSAEYWKRVWGVVEPWVPPLHLYGIYS